VQVTRSLREEFLSVLAKAEWDVALLQEAPPRWLAPLVRATGASGASALTSRNFGAGLRGSAAERRPDLLGSWEGGSNQTLVRPPWRIEEVRRLNLTHRPERRRLLWTLLSADRPGEDAARLAVANLHASISGHGPERDVDRGAAVALAWAGSAPLVFGGDLNIRPALSPESFRRLDSLGLAPPAADHSVDHLLGRGLDLVEGPRMVQAEWREVEAAEGGRLRLSDHDPVVVRFGIR